MPLQKRSLTQAEKDEIRELRENGTSAAEVAKRFNLELSSVYRIQKEAPNAERRRLELAGNFEHLRGSESKRKNRLTLEERNELIMRYKPLVRALTVRIYWRMNRKIDQEDLEQEGYLSLTKHADLHDPNGLPFQCYISKAVRQDMWLWIGASHLAPKKLKTRKKNEAALPEIVSLDAPLQEGTGATMLHLLEGKGPDPCNAAINSQLREQVKAVYETLPVHQQGAIQLVFAEDISWLAGSKKVGCGRNTFKNRVLGGITEIRSSLGVEVEGFQDLTYRKHRGVTELGPADWKAVEELMTTDTPRDWIAAKFRINRGALFSGYKNWKKSQQSNVLFTYRTRPAQQQLSA